ncbi:sulfotransferase family 2 domain-containing protein [Salinisphaera sp. RV14]|uniref:sulfotransferase family 2 domain-containing protein n=1 Tax=Salinisphaera sp. RV14 TaxID=3454140 RepID=UPI003F82C96F
MKAQLLAALDRRPRRDVRFWVSHEHRLVFLRIPKNASSYMRALFTANHPLGAGFDASAESPRGYRLRTGIRDIPVTRRTIHRARHYKTFVVIRDPMARIVSGFLDRVVKKSTGNPPDAPHPRFYRGISRFHNRDINRRTITFEQFLDYVLAKPDKQRNKHYRSQSHFLGRHRFDFYGCVDNLSDTLAFLREQGMVTDGFHVASSKKTAYAAPGAHAIDCPARATARDLNGYDHFPAVADFFDGSSLDRFVEAYRADIRLYVRARGIDMRQLIDRY